MLVLRLSQDVSMDMWCGWQTSQSRELLLDMFSLASTWGAMAVGSLSIWCRGTSIAGNRAVTTTSAETAAFKSRKTLPPNRWLVWTIMFSESNMAQKDARVWTSRIWAFNYLRSVVTTANKNAGTHRATFLVNSIATLICVSRALVVPKATCLKQRLARHSVHGATATCLVAQIILDVFPAHSTSAMCVCMHLMRFD